MSVESGEKRGSLSLKQIVELTTSIHKKWTRGRRREIIIMRVVGFLPGRALGTGGARHRRCWAGESGRDSPEEEDRDLVSKWLRFWNLCNICPFGINKVNWEQLKLERKQNFQLAVFNSTNTNLQDKTNDNQLSVTCNNCISSEKHTLRSFITKIDFSAILHI